MIDLPEQEHDLTKAPPIWWAFRDQEPTRPISYAIVSMNGKRVGRIDRPDVMKLDEQFLLERFPALYDPGAHEVRLDFRAQRGRGALGQVTVTFGDPSTTETAGPAAVHASPETALVDWAQRVMVQNERLTTKLMEQIQTNATNSMDVHERMVTMMAASMERDRSRQSDWLEREAQLRSSQFESTAARAAAGGDQQARLLEMILPLLAGGNGGQNAFMEQIQAAVSDKLLGTVLGKIEQMDGDGGDPMAQMIGTLGPMLAEKFMGGGPPDGGQTPPAA